MSLLTGLLYDRDERMAKGFVQGTFKGLFPLLDFGVNYGGHATKRAGSDGAASETIDSWRETELSGGLRLPLNLTRGVHAMHLEAGVQAGWTKITGRNPVEQGDDGNGDRARVSYQARFVRIRDGARRDVRPVWGQTARISYAHTPLGGDDHGSLLSLSLGCYLPGIRRHHALTLNGGFETQRPRNYRFDSALGFPRGFDSRYHRRLMTASVDYAFPVADPDVAFGPFLYFKRVTGNLFFDHGLGADGGVTQQYRSTGVELFFENHIMSWHFPIRLGARYIYRIDRQSDIDRPRHSVEPILGLWF
jgi:outer membrane protein assembly factor BamA